MSCGRRAVDGSNFGMGQGRPQDTSVQHPGKRDINRKAGCTRDFGASVLPWNRFADHREDGIRGQRRGLLDRDPPLYFAQADARDAIGKFLSAGCRVGNHDQAFRAEAAASVAETTWGYVPQRQKWPLIAALTLSAVGSDLCSSSAAQVITMPGVQKPHCSAS